MGSSYCEELKENENTKERRMELAFFSFLFVTWINHVEPLISECGNLGSGGCMMPVNTKFVFPLFPSRRLVRRRGGLPYGDSSEKVRRFPPERKSQGLLRNNNDKKILADEKITARPHPFRNDEEWIFFDTARVNVRGGDGGDGCVAFRREKGVPMGGPSGGNGGRGGSIILKCNPHLNTLSMLRRQVHYRAPSGQNGQGKSKHGRSAEDVIVNVPPGTIVQDLSGCFAGELLKEGDSLMVARGGCGGRGNEAFKTQSNNAPKLSERGEQGIEHWLNVELRLVADVGFVGVPNVGKSSLLGASSNAKPKIADYPFTTVVPNLGVCDLISFDNSKTNGDKNLVLADIPGLLEGAHEGKGMGVAFLRHIARCRVLIHVVDGTSPDPVGDLHAINEELRLFKPVLALKPQVIVINKIDIPEVRHRAPQLLHAIRTTVGHNRVMNVSAATGENCKELLWRTAKFLDSQPDPLTFTESEPNIPRISLDPEEGISGTSIGLGPNGVQFEIKVDPSYPGQFRVHSARIERLVQMTNWDYFEARDRFERVLEATGIVAALEKHGAIEGDTVMIADMDFDYSPTRNKYLPQNLGDREYR